MKIKKYDPLKDLAKDWFMDPFFGPSRLMSRFFGNWPDFTLDAELEPSVDVKETTEGYEIAAELPGFDKKDINVEIKDNVLTIKGHRKFERDEKKERFHVMERREGSFSRAFTLPQDADISNVGATYEDGVLILKIARTEESKPRTIDIKVE